MFQIHTSQGTQAGDILVFLTGQEEINAADEQILTISKKLGTRIAPLVVVPIYANLDSEQQNKIFEKVDCRKIILATKWVFQAQENNCCANSVVVSQRQVSRWTVLCTV